MIFERFGILFWLAVAVLASRVVLEVARRLNGRLHSDVPLVAGHPRGTRVIFVARPPAEEDPIPPQSAPTRPVEPPPKAPAPNLLETMSHDEMDRLLKPRA